MIEIRLDQDKSIDEVVSMAGCASVHLEDLGENGWSLIIQANGDQPHSVHITLPAGKATIYEAENCTIKPYPNITAKIKPKYNCGVCEDSGWLWDVNRKVRCDCCEAGAAWLNAETKALECMASALDIDLPEKAEPTRCIRGTELCIYGDSNHVICMSIKV